MKQKNYKTVFEKEWAIYRADRSVSVRGNQMRSVRFGTRFDGGVKTGEIRLFADSVPPRMALVLASEGPRDWMVVPISDFTVPATSDEALVGNRVYQFWNAKSLPRALVSRSWIVSVLSREECDEVDQFYRAVNNGEPLPKGMRAQVGLDSTGVDLVRLEYEREFVLSEESFDYQVRDPVILTEINAVAMRQFSEDMAYAADDPGSTSQKQSCIICNSAYLSCELELPFVALRKDADPGVLVFSWKGTLPKEWKVGRRTRVTLHDRVTRRQIGEGRINLRKKEIVVDQFDGLEGLDNPVKRASDAVIVLSPTKG